MLYTNLQVCLLVVNFSGSRWWGEVGEEVRRGGRHRDEEDDEEEEDEGGEEEEEEEVQLEASRTGSRQQQQNWVRSMQEGLWWQQGGRWELPRLVPPPRNLTTTQK